MSKLANYRARRRAGMVLPLAAVAALAAGGLSTALAKGASYEVLYNFAGDGEIPYDNLKRSNSGHLYGTTLEGGGTGCGGNGCGTVFKITKSGAETVLYSFEGSGNCGFPGRGTLINDSAGNLYGMTILGGAGCEGSVFELAPDGTETVLHSFGGGLGDGAYPEAGLTADSKGNLYGTTQEAGAHDVGTVFEVALDGTETLLHSFAGPPNDGAYPRADLLTIGGNIYSTTYQGGANNDGTVFELVKGKKGAWTEKVLHSFAGADGMGPWADLTKDSAGNVYGTAIGGGANGYGDVFKLAPDGTFTVLYSFQGSGDGEYPYSAVLMAKNGDLYGTTGGTQQAPYFGTVFQLAPDGTETVLHAFAGSPNDGSCALGAGPLTEIGGYLYGTTYEGGSSNLGIAFRIKE
ncbi:MAG TPA: choice-of-anchor tandem repeat GloVer-containing protein [Rhizomicrobium sp.]|jgi:uncharacterized repeat protein (TIGR03803 family)|nr:choice-of-anchor tandem repeat GloVer-containing protein [Rhizomicrobium sp.]